MKKLEEDRLFSYSACELIFSSSNFYFPLTKLSFLDNSSTTQKPKSLIHVFDVFCDQLRNKSFFEVEKICVQKISDTKNKISKLINCPSDKVNFFPQGASFALNYLSNILFQKLSIDNKKIVVSNYEHHSNLVPWQRLCSRQKNFNLSFKALNNDDLLTVNFDEVAVLSIALESNVLGSVWRSDFSDLKIIVQKARQAGCLVIIDACQSVGYQEVDFKFLDVDYLVFSPHKLLGPTGLGVLVAKNSVDLKFDELSLLREVVEFDEALNYILPNVSLIKKHCNKLTNLLLDFLEHFSNVTILGDLEKNRRSGHLVSFSVQGVNSHDLAAFLGEHNVCVRAGNHCSQIIHDHIKVQSSVRISFFAYNTIDDVERFKSVFIEAINFFGVGG